MESLIGIINISKNVIITFNIITNNKYNRDMVK